MTIWWASLSSQQLGMGSLAHQLYVSLVSAQMERVSEICHFKLGHYGLALFDSPVEEACKHLFKGLLGYLGIEEA